MDKQQFLDFYGVNRTSVYHYRKLFPEFLHKKQFDFGLMHKEIQKREDLKIELQTILSGIPGEVLYPLFTNNKFSVYMFLSRLYSSRDTIIMTNKTYFKMQKIKKFMEELNGKDNS